MKISKLGTYVLKIINSVSNDFVFLSCIGPGLLDAHHHRRAAQLGAPGPVSGEAQFTQFSAFESLDDEKLICHIWTRTYNTMAWQGQGGDLYLSHTCYNVFS